MASSLAADAKLETEIEWIIAQGLAISDCLSALGPPEARLEIRRAVEDEVTVFVGRAPEPQLRWTACTRKLSARRRTVSRLRSSRAAGSPSRAVSLVAYEQHASTKGDDEPAEAAERIWTRYAGTPPASRAVPRSFI